MQLVKRIIRKVFFPIRNIKFQKEQKRQEAYIVETKTQKRVFLFGSPGHGNMGDQAQTYCIQRWLNNNYNDYLIIIFTFETATDRMINIIMKNINSNDKIFFHSGYHLTDLYPGKKLYCKIVELFKHYRIVIFPQTISFFNDKEDEKHVTNIFNQHGKITLMCRDEFSYETAKNIFNQCNLLLYPDIVTSLIGMRQYDNNRKGVLFCIRDYSDKESLYGKKKINELKTKLKRRFDHLVINQNDTTIATSYSIIKNKREEILEEMLQTFSKYQLVITDRYHGTIFSLVANTPVIVIASTDHKLSSGVKWFPECFHDYVFYADNLDIAYEKAIEILNNTSYKYKLPPYFEQNYYSKLKKKLENNETMHS
jgi:exopolysaccharide biosynthesis predicted pyruvyltransferase EpsI